MERLSNNVSTVISWGNLSTQVPLKMERVGFPKRRFEIIIHGTKSQKTSLIDTAVKASQKAAVFEI
jgi:hypothetical protein